MKKIRSLLLALVAVTALFAAVTASPAAAATPTSYTACDGTSGFLGTRVCVDKTTPSGPIAYVFTSATGLYTAFQVCGNAMPSSFVATEFEWDANGVANTPGHPGTLSPNTAIGGTGIGLPGYSSITGCSDQNAANLLAWFAASPGYEFVMAN